MVSALELLAEAEHRGARFSVVGDRLRAVPEATITPDLYEAIGAHKAEVIEELCRRQEQAAALIDKANAAGLILTAGDDSLLARHRTDPAPGAPKDRPRTAQVKRTSRRVLCASCRRIDRAYEVSEGVYVCGACLEWRTAGRLHFTILHGADEAEAAKRGCCLACGSSIELHGSPPPATWRRVAALDDVHLAEVRFVLASAGA